MPFSFTPNVSPDPNLGQTATSSRSVPLQPGNQASPASSGIGGMMNLARRVEQGSGSLFDLVLFIAFGAMVLWALGLVGYKFYLSSQIQAKVSRLEELDSQLSAMPLDGMRTLSARVRIISQLIKEHPSVNVAFKIVEDSVENQITYSKFDLRFNEQAKSFNLSLNGIAPNYRAISQQVDTLKREPYTKYINPAKVVVEGLAPNPDGKINFGVNMPIIIAGLLPENVTFTEGAAERITPQITESTVSTTTIPVIATTTQATSTASVPRTQTGASSSNPATPARP